jgi:hypothetical protein
VKTYELERLLTDRKAAGRLTNRARTFQRLYGDTGESDGRPATRMAVTEPPARLCTDGRRPPAADDDVAEGWPLAVDLDLLFPELAGQDPKRVVSELTVHCRKDRSEQHEHLLEAAVNALTTSGELDAEGEKLVDEATGLLSAPPAEEQSSADSISTRLYVDRELRGRSLYVNHRRSKVYRRIRERLLDRADLVDDVSSLWLEASEGETTGEVILFDDDRFLGDFRRFSTKAPERTRVRNVGHFIEDRAASALVVRRYANEIPFPLSAMGVIDQIKKVVDRIPSIDEVRGSPRITWDLWPEGEDDHPNDPGRRLLEVKVPVVIDVPHWFDYDAEIRFWIYVYVEDGVLQGYTAHYGAWVEGGLITSCVLDRIMDRLGNYVGRVDRMVGTALALANSFQPIRRQYFLPGGGSMAGTTEDDVTLVLVREAG